MTTKRPQDWPESKKALRIMRFVGQRLRAVKEDAWKVEAAWNVLTRMPRLGRARSASVVAGVEA